MVQISEEGCEAGHSNERDALIQVAFEYLQGWRFHNSPGKLVTVLSHPYRKKSLPRFSQRTSYMSDCAHCLLSCSWVPLKRAWFHPLCTFRYLYPWIQFTWSFSSPGWTVSALSAIPYDRDAPVSHSSYWPFLGPSPVAPHLSYTGELSTGHHSTCGLSAELRARITSLHLLQHSS